MLLTLATRSLASRIASDGGMSLLDVPDFAISHLELRGLNVPASMLAGWSLQDLDRLRDRADKAGCPCLVLIEDAPLAFGSRSPAKRDAAADRLRRVASAAHRLGCNSLAISCDGADNDETLELVAQEAKRVMPGVERMELNVLIAPHKGLTHSPDRLTDLIKRIGGFRIGSLPSFGHAASTGDLVGTLRKLAPYAGAVHATVDGFGKNGEHQGYDLAECVSAIRSVGFLNTLAIDYAGKKDPVKHLEEARGILQEAIDADQ
jgi:sugar phosphate isomerase/epimerase